MLRSHGGFIGPRQGDWDRTVWQNRPRVLVHADYIVRPRDELTWYQAFRQPRRQYAHADEVPAGDAFEADFDEKELP